MAKTPPKDYFASVMFPGSKKLSIVSKRVGTKERLHAIATVTNELVADRIVEALNAHQGLIEKLDLPHEAMLVTTREELTKQRALHSQYHSKTVSLESEVRSLKTQLERAIRERDAAQAKARDAAGLTHPALSQG